MVANVCNPSTQEARLKGHQFKVNISYIEFGARLQSYRGKKRGQRGRERENRVKLNSLLLRMHTYMVWGKLISLKPLR